MILLKKLNQYRKDIYDHRVVYMSLDDLNRLKETTALGEDLSVGSEIFFQDKDKKNIGLYTITNIDIALNEMTFQLSGSPDSISLNFEDVQKYISEQGIQVPKNYEQMINILKSTKLLNKESSYEFPQKGFFIANDDGLVQGGIEYEIKDEVFYIEGQRYDYKEMILFIRANSIKDILSAERKKDGSEDERSGSDGGGVSFHTVSFGGIFGQLKKIVDKIKEKYKEKSEYAAMQFAASLPFIGGESADMKSNFENKKIGEFESKFDSVDAEAIEKEIDKLLGGRENLPWPYMAYETQFFYQGALLALLNKTGSIRMESKPNEPYYWFKKLGVEHLRVTHFSTSKAPLEEILLDCLKRSSNYPKDYCIKYESKYKAGLKNKEESTKSKINFLAGPDKAIDRALVMLGFNDNPESISDEKVSIRPKISFLQMQTMDLKDIQARLQEGSLSPELDPYSFAEAVGKSSIPNGQKFALIYMLVVVMAQKDIQISDDVANKMTGLTKDTGFPLFAMFDNKGRAKLNHLMTKTISEPQININSMSECWEWFANKDKDMKMLTKSSKTDKLLVSPESNQYMLDYLGSMTGSFNISKTTDLQFDIFRTNPTRVVGIGFGMVSELALDSFLRGGSTSSGELSVGEPLKIYMKSIISQLALARTVAGDKTRSISERVRARDEVISFGNLLNKCLKKLSVRSVYNEFSSKDNIFLSLTVSGINFAETVNYIKDNRDELIKTLSPDATNKTNTSILETDKAFSNKYREVVSI